MWKSIRRYGSAKVYDHHITKEQAEAYLRHLGYKYLVKGGRAWAEPDEFSAELEVINAGLMYIKGQLMDMEGSDSWCPKKWYGRGTKDEEWRPIEVEVGVGA